MRMFILSGMMLFPMLAFGATDCRIIENPDNFEVVCVGDIKSEPTAVNTATTSLQPDMTTLADTPLQETSESGSSDKSDRTDTANVPRTKGTRRLQASTMEAARAMRLRIMQEQQQNENNSNLPNQ